LFALLVFRAAKCVPNVTDVGTQRIKLYLKFDLGTIRLEKIIFRFIFKYYIFD